MIRQVSFFGFSNFLKHLKMIRIVRSFALRPSLGFQHLYSQPGFDFSRVSLSSLCFSSFSDSHCLAWVFEASTLWTDGLLTYNTQFNYSKFEAKESLHVFFSFSISEILYRKRLNLSLFWKCSFWSRTNSTCYFFQDCTPDEFHMFMSMLALTRLPKMVTGQSKIVELITKTGEAHFWILYWAKGLLICTQFWPSPYSTDYQLR